MPRLTLMNEGIMLCRMRGIYRKMLRNDMNGAINLIKDTICALDTCEIDMDVHKYKFCDRMLRNMLIEMAVKQHANAHNKLRTIVYAL